MFALLFGNDVIIADLSIDFVRMAAAGKFVDTRGPPFGGAGEGDFIFWALVTTVSEGSGVLPGAGWVPKPLLTLSPGLGGSWGARVRGTPGGLTTRGGGSVAVDCWLRATKA